LDIITRWSQPTSTTSGNLTQGGIPVSLKCASPKRIFETQEQFKHFVGLILISCVSDKSTYEEWFDQIIKFYEIKTDICKSRFKNVLPQFDLSDDGVDNMFNMFKDINIKLVDGNEFHLIDETICPFTWNNTQREDRKNIGQRKNPANRFIVKVK
jgi:hypothetical protein